VTFVLELPAGESFADLDHELAEVKLSEAVERASFEVFAVRKLPQGEWRIRVLYAAPTRRPPMPESVHINYMREDAQNDLAITETAVDAPADWPEVLLDEAEAEAVIRDGVSYRVHSGEGRAFGLPARVQFERDGTRIVMTSQALDVDALLGLAAELVEAGR
jgi:hypothetical protein